MIYHFAKDNAGERIFSKNFSNGTLFAEEYSEVLLFFIVDFGQERGAQGCAPVRFFFVCKIGVFVRRKLQNFAKLCKKLQKFARKFAYIKKMLYLCNVFRKWSKS